jgi:hypothetical protein
LTMHAVRVVEGAMWVGVRLTSAVVACALAGVVGACAIHEDPIVTDNGPTFVVVGKSSAQPPKSSGSVSMYVEARGGNYVGILTHGCGHRLAGVTDEAASCGVLPDATNPMYFLVEPVPGQDCTVEARLYYVCDDAGLLPLHLGGLGQFKWCDAVGSLMGSVEEHLLEPTDASTDGGNEVTDAMVPTADVGDVRTGPPL